MRKKEELKRHEVIIVRNVDEIAKGCRL